MSEPETKTTIAVIGGTGREGRGLAYRWAKAGYQVIIGSRSAERAVATAAEIGGTVDGATRVTGMSNEQAARHADVVALAVPYAAHREILESIRTALEGKLLIDATVPLVPGKLSQAQMPDAGSAAAEARKILGLGSELASAFHNISHEYLLRDEPIDSDVLVTGTSRKARAQAVELVEAAGLRAWDAGALENSAVTEGLASVLIHLNRMYGSKQAGIRITGIEKH
jgi:8-hydroxy-5-deazaflavin:NADPH oxidoreductase